MAERITHKERSDSAGVVTESILLHGRDSTDSTKVQEIKSTAGAGHVAVKSTDNHPTTLSDSNVAVVAASGTLTLGDLTQYGFPYGSLIFTEAGASNAATITWSVCQGQFRFQIAGTTPDVDLTATNSNGDTFSDVPVMSIDDPLAILTGQTLGAGQFYLPRI